jgi:hypothetical protein
VGSAIIATTTAAAATMTTQKIRRNHHMRAFMYGTEENIIDIHPTAFVSVVVMERVVFVVVTFRVVIPLASSFCSKPESHGPLTSLSSTISGNRLFGRLLVLPPLWRKSTFWNLLLIYAYRYVIVYQNELTSFYRLHFHFHFHSFMEHLVSRQHRT